MYNEKNNPFKKKIEVDDGIPNGEKKKYILNQYNNIDLWCYLGNYELKEYPAKYLIYIGEGKKLDALENGEYKNFIPCCASCYQYLYNTLVSQREKGQDYMLKKLKNMVIFYFTMI